MVIVTRAHGSRCLSINVTRAGLEDTSEIT